jgi:hypothetical protein
MESPIASAYRLAVENRLLSMIYSTLNGSRSPKELKRFRKEWTERGCHQLEELLIQSARPDWESYPEAFWVDPWIGRHLQESRDGGGSFCHFLSLWLEDEPLPAGVDENPYVEDRKVRDLERLFRSLNP